MNHIIFLLINYDSKMVKWYFLKFNEYYTQKLSTDLDPGYECICNTGYEGRGFMGECRDIDECFLQTHACVLTDGQVKVSK